MSYGLGRHQDRGRRRRQALLTVTKWLLVIFIFVGIGYQAHQAGTMLAQADFHRVSGELTQTQRRVSELDAERQRLRLERDEARAGLAQLQQRYDANVPTGPLAEALTLVRERLAGGLAAERVQHAIRTAEDTRRCTGPSVTKRFRIGLGTRASEDEGTSFAEGMIAVSAVSSSASDLARQTVVTFSGLGAGGPVSVTGLPASHLYVLNNRELRVVVAESPVRGFAAASITTCGS